MPTEEVTGGNRLAPPSSEISLSLEPPATFEVESSKGPAPATPSTESVTESPALESPGAISLSAAEPAGEPAALSLGDPGGGLELSTGPGIAEPVASTPSAALISVKPVGRRAGAKNETKLIVWERELLKKGKDPLGRGIAMLLEKGVKSALFLAITAPPPGSPVPHFTATAAAGATKNKMMIWTGMKWDPTIVPDAWNYFVRTGYIELAPPGTITNMKSNRNVIRGAFGIDKEEYLILVRAGPASSCRGVVAFVAKGTLQTEISSAMPLLEALPGKAAA
jgi:hypothetical protein